MCFSVIDINIYMCTKAPIFSITHLCARMNVEDCLPKKNNQLTVYKLFAFDNT